MIMNKQFDILVIDDEQVIIDAVDKICSAEGYKVDSAVSAADALNKFDKNTYSLAVCDIMMPEIDGFQVLAEIARKKIFTFIIMTTGYSTVENAVKSLYNGAIDFIPKPFTADELLNSVSRGLKYFEIQKVLANKSRAKEDSALIYVPCPAKYFRLGYSGWAYEESIGSVQTGVTDLFVKAIETVESIELFKLDEEIIQGNTCAYINSAGGLKHAVLAPVSGRIIERNEQLISGPAILEKDPYFSGWFYRVIPSDSEYELKHLIPCSSDRL